MNAWEEVLVEWCNCLELSKKIEDFNELRNGDFFTNILYLINKADGSKSEDVIKNLITILNNIYNNAQFGFSQCNSFLELSQDDLRILTSLLMHYTCIYDRRDILTSPLCHALPKNTQVCIKNFLERVDNEVSCIDLKNIINEFMDNFNEVSIENNGGLSSPLIGILKTPVSKASKFHEKDREITKLKNLLDMERYEKADLQEELKVQNNKIKKFEYSLNKSNSDIVRLKRQINALESRTPPHFLAIDPMDTEKRLKKEIQSLEHYIEKSEKEQEVLREESYSNVKKLKEWEQEYGKLRVKYLEYEKQVEDLTKLSDTSAARITSLESYCEELNSILEEFQTKPSNESSMFETSSVHVRRSLTLTEENLACSVVEVQLKDAQEQNRQMMMKIDSLNLELDNNKKNLDSVVKEYVTICDELRVMKHDVLDMKKYYVQEKNEYINYLKKIKQTFITVIVANYEKTIENLFGDLLKEKETSQSLSIKLSDTLSNFEKCNEELEKVIREKKDCVENIAQLEKEMTDLDEQKQDLTSKLNNSQANNEKYLDKVDSLEKDAFRYKYELDQLQNEKNKHLLDIQNLKMFCDEINDKNENLSSKLNVFEETNEYYTKIFNDIKLNVKDMKKYYEEKMKDYIDHVEEIKQTFMTVIMKNYKESIERMSKEIIREKETSQSLSIELAHRLSNFVKCNEKLEEVINEKKNCDENIAQLEKAFTELDKQKQDLSLKLNNSELRNNEYLDRIDSLERGNIKFRYQLDELENEKKRYLSNIHSLENCRNQLQGEKENLSLKLTVLEEINKDYMARIAVSEETNANLNKELNQLLFDNNKFSNEFETLKDDFEKLNSQNEVLISKLTDSEKTNMDYTTRILLSEETNKNLNEKLNQVLSDKNMYVNQFETLKDDFEEINSKNEDLSSKLNTTVKRNKEQITRIQSLEEEIQRKITELKKVELEKSECVSEIETLRRNCQNFIQIIEDLNSKFTISGTTIGEYLIKINLLEETIKQKNIAFDKVLSENDEYVRQMKDIQHDHERLKKKVVELSSENREKNKLLIEKKSLEEDYISLIKNIAIYNRELNKIAKNLKRQQPIAEISDLEEDDSSFNELRQFDSQETSDCSEKSDDINQLGLQISKINAYVHLCSEKEALYLNEIDRLKGELATNSNNYFHLTQNLKEQNSDDEMLITSLTENLHSVIEKYNQLQMEHREYLDEISGYQTEITQLKKTHSDVTLSNELKITNLQDEILKLKEKILSLNNIKNNMRDTYENQRKLLEEKLLRNEGEVNLLKEEMEKLTVEYQTKVDAAQETIAKLEEQKCIHEKNLEDFRTSYASKIEILLSDISNKEELINSLNEKREDQETKITTLKVQIALAKEEISQFKNKSSRTEEEYQSTLANLQVQVVGSRLEVTKNSNKVEKLQTQIRTLEEERNKEVGRRTVITDGFEREREINMQLRNELAEKEVLLKQVEKNKELQEKYEKLKQEILDQKFFEQKQVELQQKIETLMKSNDIQKETYETFKIHIKEFRNNLDKILSQKNILETLANNLRVLVVSINKNAPGENFNLRTLFEKKEALEVIAEDIMKQYNRCSKKINDIVFDVLKYFERTCDNLLSTLDIKIENYSEKYNLEELNDQISDLTERTADALEQVKILQKDLENLSRVEDVKIQKENILVTSRKVNVDKMKEDELKKKNLVLRQKVTLSENVKSNLEKTVKRLREENKKIKEEIDKMVPNNDAHYNMLLQEYVVYKEKHDNIVEEFKTKYELLQKEYEEHKNGCMRTSTPVGDAPVFTHEAEKHLHDDLTNLREAYANIRTIKAKLENENVYSKKLIEEQRQEIGKFNFMKEAYDKLLEENSKLMSDVDTMKYKRTRDRDEFLRLLKKERSENANRIQEIRVDYEAKLEKMKDKMIKLYRDEVNKEMSKVKAGQHESSALLKIIEQLKGDLFEAEQKVQVLEAERDILKRSRDHSHIHSSRDSISSIRLQDTDATSLRDFPSTSISSSASGVANSRAFSTVARQVEFKRPSSTKTSGLDAKRQSEMRRASTLPRTGTVVEEVAVTRSTSFGVPDSIGPSMHMEDEEEMFNNKYLADLKQGKCDLPVSDDRDSRISELAWRNSLVPPHLKSSYPAEMQFFSPARFKDDEIKAGNLPFDDSLCKLLPGEKPRKKDFGTTSYKKPGPPTPSKNGGRLSLQGNEVHPTREPPTEPKRSTPGRIRALFTGRTTSKSSSEVTSPKRRLNIFRR